MEVARPGAIVRTSRRTLIQETSILVTIGWPTWQWLADQLLAPLMTKEVLLKAVLDGQINPGKVFTQSYKLDDIDQAYKDMADRKRLKL